MLPMHRNHTAKASMFLIREIAHQIPVPLTWRAQRGQLSDIREWQDVTPSPDLFKPLPSTPQNKGETHKLERAKKNRTIPCQFYHLVAIHLCPTHPAALLCQVFVTHAGLWLGRTKQTRTQKDKTFLSSKQTKRKKAVVTTKHNIHRQITQT
jgi:hypothetical protein